MLFKILGLEEVKEVTPRIQLLLNTTARQMLVGGVRLSPEDWYKLRPESRKAFYQAGTEIALTAQVNTGMASMSMVGNAEVRRPLDDGFVADQMNLETAMQSYLQTEGSYHGR